MIMDMFLVPDWWASPEAVGQVKGKTNYKKQKGDRKVKKSKNKKIKKKH